MAKRFILVPTADMDMQEIIHYIARDNPIAARKIRKAIITACEALSQHPLMGQVRDDLTQAPVRFWPVHRSYMIIYNPNSNPVEILRLYNSARDVPALLLQ